MLETWALMTPDILRNNNRQINSGKFNLDDREIVFHEIYKKSDNMIEYYELKIYDGTHCVISIRHGHGLTRYNELPKQYAEQKDLLSQLITILNPLLSPDGSVFLDEYASSL